MWSVLATYLTYGRKWSPALLMLPAAVFMLLSGQQYSQTPAAVDGRWAYVHVCKCTPVDRWLVAGGRWEREVCGTRVEALP